MPALLRGTRPRIDLSRREFLKVIATGAALASGAILGLGHVAEAIRYVETAKQPVTPEYLKATLEADVVVYTTKAGDAVAILADGRVIKSTNHKKVLQWVFDELENQARTVGALVVLAPRACPFKIPSGETGIHIPCENGGKWHIVGPGSSRNTVYECIVHEGEGPVIESYNAKDYWTAITIEGIDVKLNSRKANGFYIDQLVAARDLAVKYNADLGEPETRTYGLAYRGGDAIIENCHMAHVHAGFVSIGHPTMGVTDVVLINCFVEAASWTEFGFLIPHDVGWSPIAALQDLGYPVEGFSGQQTLIKCHFLGKGRNTNITTPSGYTVNPCAFRVNECECIGCRVEGEIFVAFENNLDVAVLVKPHITGTIGYQKFRGRFIVHGYKGPDGKKSGIVANDTWYEEYDWYDYVPTKRLIPVIDDCADLPTSGLKKGEAYICYDSGLGKWVIKFWDGEAWQTVG